MIKHNQKGANKNRGKKKMTVHTAANSKAEIHETHGITETLLSNMINAHQEQIQTLHTSYKAQLKFLQDTIKEKDKRIVKLEEQVK